uniref:hypothetical protein n=1 Tax=Aquisphaera insulae TaxID=2712864 RepID=UPI00196B371C
MRYQVRSIPKLITSSLFLLIASGAGSAVVQEPGGPARNAAPEKPKGGLEAVDRQKVSTGLGRSEQALWRIRNRAVNDHDLRNLAVGPIY